MYEHESVRPHSRWRHVVRGSTYTVLAVATGQGDDVEDKRLVVYAGSDGKVWARPLQAFCDGRFVPAEDPGTTEGQSTWRRMPTAYNGSWVLHTRGKVVQYRMDGKFFVYDLDGNNFSGRDYDPTSFESLEAAKAYVEAETRGLQVSPAAQALDAQAAADGRGGWWDVTPGRGTAQRFYWRGKCFGQIEQDAGTWRCTTEAGVFLQRVATEKEALAVVASRSS